MQNCKAATSKHQFSTTYAPHIHLQSPLQDGTDSGRSNKKKKSGGDEKGRGEEWELEARAPVLGGAVKRMGGAIGEWQRGPVIGRGATATVSIATDRLTGDVFAVKSVEVARAGVLRREQSVLSVLSSQYVVSCVGAGVSAAAGGGGAAWYDLFLEFAPGGSLADEIKRCGGRCEEALIRLRAGDVLRALAHVHGSGIAHCDVKARNVLVGADGRAKLADFGCARWTSSAEDGNAGGASTVRGTPAFLSPEAARGEAQGPEADIWALGCTVIEMATGGSPWPRFTDPVAALHHVAHSGDVPEAPAFFSDEGRDFLARCLTRDPAQRWTAEQLLQHPFVASSSYASSRSSAATKAAAPIEQRVSPKSILDQGFWEDSSTDSDTTATPLTPADRLRALAAGGRPVAPDWTWSGEDWITVCGHTPINDTTLSQSPESDAETTVAGSSGGGDDDDDDDLISSSSTGGDGGERAAVDAPRGHGHGHGRPHGGDSVSSRHCNNDNTCSNSFWRASNGRIWLNHAAAGEPSVRAGKQCSLLVFPLSPFQPSHDVLFVTCQS